MSSKIWRVCFVQGKTIWLLVFNCSSVAFSYIIIGKVYSVKLKSNLETLIVVEQNFLEGLEGEFERMAMTLTLQLGPACVVIARL